LVDRILSDVDEVNDYFAGISYLPGCAGGFCSSVGSASPNDDLYIHDFELEPYLLLLLLLGWMQYLVGFYLNVCTN